MGRDMRTKLLRSGRRLSRLYFPFPRGHRLDGQAGFSLTGGVGTHSRQRCMPTDAGFSSGVWNDWDSGMLCCAVLSTMR